MLLLGFILLVAGLALGGGWMTAFYVWLVLFGIIFLIGLFGSGKR